jgi:hypothetical protein
VGLFLPISFTAILAASLPRTCPSALTRSHFCSISPFLAKKLLIDELRCISENGHFSRVGGIVKLFFKENNKKAYPDVFRSVFVLHSFNEGRFIRVFQSRDRQGAVYLVV